MTHQTNYARCHCAECERLDRTPARLQGIPHAWQPNMLNSYDDAPYIAPSYAPEPEPIRTAQPWESLPLFGTLEPDLFA